MCRSPSSRLGPSDDTRSNVERQSLGAEVEVQWRAILADHAQLDTKLVGKRNRFGLVQTQKSRLLKLGRSVGVSRGLFSREEVEPLFHAAIVTRRMPDWKFRSPTVRRRRCHGLLRRRTTAARRLEAVSLLDRRDPWRLAVEPDAISICQCIECGHVRGR